MLFWLRWANNPDITSTFTDIYATYIPFISSDGNSSSCCCSCYSHKMPTANVAGKQRSTNLQRQKTKIGSYVHGNFWKIAFIWHIELMPVYGGGDDENDWQPTSLITCRTPTHCSHWNQSLQPSHLQQRGRIGCWIKYLPVESENILHQYRFKNICKTGQTDIGMISTQSGKKTVIFLVQGRNDKDIPTCQTCTPSSTSHSLYIQTCHLWELGLVHF